MAFDKDTLDALIIAPERMKALHDTGLLDTPEEDVFNRITRTICRETGAPMSLITLIDKDRQFFKSQSGLAITSRQGPLSHSICKYVVLNDGPVVIDDVRTHPYTMDKLALPTMGFMAYLGAPLFSGGQIIGSLCAVDSTPKIWSDENVGMLQDMADIAMLAIEAHKVKLKP